jgi:hypothetical protein
MRSRAKLRNVFDALSAGPRRGLVTLKNGLAMRVRAPLAFAFV